MIGRTTHHTSRTSKTTFRAHIFVEGKVKDNIIVQCGVPDTKLAKGARRARIYANPVVAGITGHFAASQRLEQHIRKYVQDHNANVDAKIKAAEDGDADAFFNDNPGLRPPKVNHMLLRSEINRVKELEVDEPTIPIIANPGEVPVDELSYALMPKREQIAFWHKLGSLVAAQFLRPLRSVIDVYAMLMHVFRKRFTMFRMPHVQGSCIERLGAPILQIESYGDGSLACLDGS
ncbi:hypothetical protein LTR17_023218 [Elasticomyces elasticus]|nr:hypothetical protein LTR17_023218 [Elasticomyces elasticus]